MRIAFASEDKLGMEGEVSAHFGRCSYYTFLEVGKLKIWRVVDNPFFGNHEPGKVPGFIHSQSRRDDCRGNGTASH